MPGSLMSAGRGVAAMGVELPPEPGEAGVGADPTPRDPGWKQVARALRGLRFGEVRVIVQDGVIVQIERLEKQRLR